MDSQPYVLMPRSAAAEVQDQFVRLFKRCVQCPPQMPVCSCDAGQTCSLFPGDCNSCAYTTCSGTQAASSTPVGAIAGGVVGGVIVLALICFLAWYVRKKRSHDDYPEDDYLDPEEWDEMQQQQEKAEQDRYSSRLNARASTHTMGSVASSNNTGRASNIIQIAYIPGVTNRSQSTPDLIPPVPPIPAASGGSSRASQADQLLFLPGDIRQSTYSSYSNRTSVATSRNSVASTIYRNDAIVNPMPAQAVNLMKPMAVSVKSSKNSPNMSRTGSPPPLSPSASHHQLNTKSSIVGKFAQPRAITVTRKNSHSLKPHGTAAFELDGSDHSVSSAANSTHHASGPGSPRSHATFDYASDEDNSRLAELPAAKTPTAGKMPSIYGRPAELNGSPSTLSQSSSSSNVPKAIQDSLMKAMQTNMGPVPDTSPFSDEHESRTP